MESKGTINATETKHVKEESFQQLQHLLAASIESVKKVISDLSDSEERSHDTMIF